MGGLGAHSWCDDAGTRATGVNFNVAADGGCRTYVGTTGSCRVRARGAGKRRARGAGNQPPHKSKQCVWRYKCELVEERVEKSLL